MLSLGRGMDRCGFGYLESEKGDWDELGAWG